MIILDSPIATGNTADIYLNEGYAVKVFHHHLPEGVALLEASKHAYAYSQGLPVPNVVEVTKIEGKQAVIMEYVNGRTIGELLLENIGQAAHLLDLTIDIQKKIHEIPPGSLEPMIGKLERQIEAAILLEKQLQSQLIKKLHSVKFEPRLCHGDFHLFNLILTASHKVMILDWVDASAGDFRADVCRTYLLYLQHDPELAELYLRIYLEKTGIQRKEIMQWAPILAAARLSEPVSSEQPERLLKIIRQYWPL